MQFWTSDDNNDKKFTDVRHNTVNYWLHVDRAKVKWKRSTLLKILDILEKSPVGHTLKYGCRSIAPTVLRTFDNEIRFAIKKFNVI